MMEQYEVQQRQKTTLLGFWVYIMTDCVLFATLFATYAVVHSNLNGGEGGLQLFNLSTVLAETLILLSSSFACGLAMLAVKANEKRLVLFWLALTALLGLAFLGIEINEFHQLALEGNSWRRSGFLSAFFTLVGTHGLHITAGLVWLGVLVFQLLQQGLAEVSRRRLAMFSMFWHFLDLVWIFIFTVVYLTGGLGL